MDNQKLSMKITRQKRISKDCAKETVGERRRERKSEVVSWAPTENNIYRKSGSNGTKTADRSRWMKLNRFCGLVKRNPCRFQQKMAFDEFELY